MGRRWRMSRMAVTPAIYPDASRSKLRSQETTPFPGIRDSLGPGR